MNETYQIALIGAAAAILGALLTALVQPLWANIIGKRSKLKVIIRHSEWQIPKFLKTSIEEYVGNYRLNVRPKREIAEKLLSLNYKSGLSTVELTNLSKKTIEGIVVHLDNNAEFWGDLTIDGEAKATQFVKSYPIGTLRAGGTCRLVLWTSSTNTTSWTPKTAVQVSANEYDKISIEHPPPDYIARRKILLPRLQTIIIMWAFAIFIWIALLGVRIKL